MLPSKENTALPGALRSGVTRRHILQATASGLVTALPAARAFAQAAAPKFGGRAVIGCTQEAVRFHPLMVHNDIDEAILLSIFNPLWRSDARGELMPELALEIPSVANGGLSADGLEWRIKLRPGVTWHDGKPFTADDVRYSIGLLQDPKFPAAFRSGAELITDITVVSPTEIHWKMSRVFSPFFSILAAAYIVPKHVLEGLAYTDASFNAKPIGTGAFRFVERRPGDYILLEANKSYFGDGPYLEQVVFRYIPDATVMKTQFVAGAIDAVTITGILADSYDEVRATHGLTLDVAPSPGILGLTLNLERPQFKELAVREALYMAMDKKAINEDVFYASVTPAETFLPKEAWAFNPDLPLHRLDPAGAKAKLDAAGWRPGAGGIREKAGTRLAFTLSTTSGDHLREQTELILQQSWSDIGVDVKIQNFPAAVIFGEFWTGSKFDMVLTSITYQTAADPDVTARFSSRAIPVKTGTGANVGQYANPDVDALLVKGTEVTDRKARIDIYRQVQSLIRADLPFLPLHQANRGEGTKTALVGYQASGAHRTNCWNLGSWHWVS